MRVLFLSHTAQTDVFRVGSHHLARELARRGHHVVHASTPMTPAHLLRAANLDVRRRARLALRPKQDADGVWHVVAVAPAPLGRGPASLGARAGAWSGRWLESTLRRAGMDEVDVALVDQPLFADALAVMRPTRLVYRPTDVHPHEPLASAERRVVERADAVVGTWQIVLESIGGAALPVPTMVLENGVEHHRFAAVGEAGPRSGIVYVGALDPRFDWDALSAMAAAAPTETFRLIGPAAAAPRDLPGNVVLVGAVPYASVPPLLRSAAVGILPLTNDPLNASRSPMKFYEYLAAGLHVVASHTPTLAVRDAPGVALYRDPAEAADLLRQQLAKPAPNDAGVEAARPYDWSERARRLALFLDAIPG
jgi:teichuronic acid biosynthesis glycosyltransferase TuaH